MNNLSISKNQFEKKIKAVNKFRSGLAMEEVCKEFNMSPKSLRYWVKNLNNREPKTIHNFIVKEAFELKVKILFDIHSQSKKMGS